MSNPFRHTSTFKEWRLILGSFPTLGSYDPQTFDEMALDEGDWAEATEATRLPWLGGLTYSHLRHLGYFLEVRLTTEGYLGTVDGWPMQRRTATMAECRRELSKRAVAKAARREKRGGVESTLHRRPKVEPVDVG